MGVGGLVVSASQPLPHFFGASPPPPARRAIRLQELRRSPESLGRTFVQRLKEVEEKKAALNREKLG